MSDLNRHTDERGIFQELHKADIDNFSPQQVSIITISPGQTRGGHYHKELIEKFILLDGFVKVTLETISKIPYIDDFMMFKKFDQFQVNPFVKHTFYSEYGATVLILSSKVFDFNNPDTYRE